MADRFPPLKSPISTGTGRKRFVKKAHYSPLSWDELTRLVEHLRKGEVGLFPTDTVYGIGCIATQHASTSLIYRIKKRPIEKTLPVLIGGWDTFNRYCGKLSAGHRKRLEQHWPGALTVVVPVSKHATGLSYHCQREGTLAVRMPDHPQLRFVIEQLGAPIAATSANLSGRVEALTLEMVPQTIRAQVGWVWGETIEHHEPVPSSVVDLTGPKPLVLRAGGVEF